MNIQHPDVIVRHVKTKNKNRKIVAYRSDDCELRIYHKKINEFLTKRFVPSIFAKGYIKGRSIYHNAVSHMYNDYFIMLDIEDFFHKICHKQLIDKVLYEINLRVPNQINKKECADIVDICSVNSRGVPLGFITSPVLSNIYLKEFDGIFYGNLKKLGLDNIIYTRYADDITVSFKHSSHDKIPDLESQIKTIASSILSRYGLSVNEKKTRAYNLNVSNHVKITGVNITKSDFGRRKLTVGRSIKNKLYWDAVKCLETQDVDQIQQVKGIQSFILSIEKNGYDECYSLAMKERICTLGYESLKHLVDLL